MLFVLFSAGADRYAIASRQIEEIVPFARLKSLPCSHPAFAGLLNFRGTPVPVLDSNLLLGASAVSPRFTSRIFLCKDASAHGGSGRLLGLLAEQVTETREILENQFRHPGASPKEAKFIGRIFEDEDGRYIQWIHPAAILSPKVAEELAATVKEPR